MPIYEYVCRACGHQWSDLVNSYGAPDPACPECDANKAEKLFSVFAKSGDTADSPATAAPHCGPHNCSCGRYN